MELHKIEKRLAEQLDQTEKGPPKNHVMPAELNPKTRKLDKLPGNKKINELDMKPGPVNIKTVKDSDGTFTIYVNNSLFVTGLTGAELPAYRAKAKKMLWDPEEKNNNLKPALQRMRAGGLLVPFKEGEEPYVEPALGTLKAYVIHKNNYTLVQVQVYKHDTIRGDKYWVTKEIKKFKTVAAGKAYADNINKKQEPKNEESVTELKRRFGVLPGKKHKLKQESELDEVSAAAMGRAADFGYDNDMRRPAMPNKPQAPIDQSSGRGELDFTQSFKGKKIGEAELSLVDKLKNVRNSVNYLKHRLLREKGTNKERYFQGELTRWMEKYKELKAELRKQGQNPVAEDSGIGSLHPKEQWWKNDPEKLLGYIYWTKGKLPPKDEASKYYQYNNIIGQLNNEHPAPMKDFARHLNAFKGWITESAGKKSLYENDCPHSHTIFKTIKTDASDIIPAQTYWYKQCKSCGHYLPGGEGEAPKMGQLTKTSYGQSSVSETNMSEGFTEPELQRIFDTHENAYRKFKSGWDLTADAEMSAFYEDLFDYFISKGEIPYGTAKARTGDPVEWVSHRISDPDYDTPIEGLQHMESIKTMKKLAGLSEERDIEYANTPKEKTFKVNAQLAQGTDVNRPKAQHTNYRMGDNPLTVEQIEEGLWDSYEKALNEMSRPTNILKTSTTKGKTAEKKSLKKSQPKNLKKIS